MKKEITDTLIWCAKVAGVGALIIGAIFGGASNVSADISDSYGINEFKGNLNKANFVIGSQTDADAIKVVFDKTATYSKSDSTSNVLVGGPVVNKLVEDINVKLDVDFEVLDSAITGDSPTRIRLKSGGKVYEVTSDDFCKKGYFAILSDGKDVAIEGTDRCATKAGATVIISTDLPYDKIIGLAEDLDDDGEFEKNEISIVEKYERIKIDGKIGDWDGYYFLEDKIGDSTAKDTVGTDISGLSADCFGTSLSFVLKIDGDFDSSKFRNYFIHVDPNYDEVYDMSFGFRPTGEVFFNFNPNPPAEMKVASSSLGEGIIEGRIDRKTYNIPDNFLIRARVTEGKYGVDYSDWLEVNCK